MCYLILSIICLVSGLVLMFCFTNDIYRIRYLKAAIGFSLIYTGVFAYFLPYINVEKGFNSIDTLTSISATIAGFVFTGISIVLALFNKDRINALFKNDFLDKLFYKSYFVIFLNVMEIGCYFFITQFDFQPENLNYVIKFNQYIFGLSIAMFSYSIYDFITLIKLAKKF